MMRADLASRNGGRQMWGCKGILGVDGTPSKAKFNAFHIADNRFLAQNGEFTSDAAAHAKFLAWLNRVGAGRTLHLCMEETGCHGQALAAFLHEAGHHVSIVNAALIKNCGRSLDVRTKNDVVGALMRKLTISTLSSR